MLLLCVFHNQPCPSMRLVLLCCAGWGIGFTPFHVYRLMAQVG